MTKFNGRRLSWQHNLGQCIVKGYFPSGVKELSVSLFQAVILLQFNDTDELTVENLKSRTTMCKSLVVVYAWYLHICMYVGEKELTRSLLSLSSGKFKILKKSGSGKDVADDDVFTVDSTFKAKLYRIKINAIQVSQAYTHT